MSEHVERHRLDNGLRVVLHQDSSLPLVAVNLWYHVGSKHERPGRTGFAHLFEHMLFQGSAHVSQNGHFQLVQQAGGVANGSTWYDRTNYYETLPANYLELGLWLESDRMGFLLPAMTEEKLENQRSVVMNERRQRVDNQPYGRASERLHELLYPPKHPYHWPVIGYMEDIAAASLEDVQAFFHTYYTPNNAVLTLAGDFEPARALDLVEGYFGSIARGPEVPPPLSAAMPERREGKTETLQDDVELPRLYLAFVAPAYGSAEWYTGSVVSTLLSEGRSSRLYRDLVYERQMVQSVGVYVLPTEECATFTVVATGRPGVDLEELEGTVVEHLVSLQNGPPEAAELARAKNHLLAGHYAELQTLDYRADRLSQFTTFFDRPEDVWSEPERYSAIDEEDVTAFARQVLIPEAAIRLRVEPAS